MLFHFLTVIARFKSNKAEYVLQKIVPNDFNENFMYGTVPENHGNSVSIYDKYAVIGTDPGWCCIDIAHAWIFELNVSSYNWTQSSKLITNDVSSNLFAASVSLYNITVVVGDPSNQHSGITAGSAYIFERDPQNRNWTQTHKLVANIPTDYDYFGHAVSIYDGYIVIGTYHSRNVYIFERDKTNNIWIETVKLLPDGGTNADYFGYAVAIYDTYVIIGAYQDDDRVGPGSAYIFERDKESNIWNQIAKLLPNDTAIGFGHSVSIYDTYVAIGTAESESVYIFERDEGNIWSQTAKLVANDGPSSSYFGSVVSIYDKSVIIGANSDDVNGFDSGSAYVFERVEQNNWIQMAKIVPNDTGHHDYFGVSVAIYDKFIVIAADKNEDNGFSAYIGWEKTNYNATNTSNYPTNYSSNYLTNYPSSSNYPTNYSSNYPTNYSSNNLTNYPSSSSNYPTNYSSNSLANYSSNYPTNYSSNYLTNHPSSSSNYPTNYSSNYLANFSSNYPTNYSSNYLTNFTNLIKIPMTSTTLNGTVIVSTLDIISAEEGKKNVFVLILVFSLAVVLCLLLFVFVYYWKNDENRLDCCNKAREVTDETQLAEIQAEDNVKVGEVDHDLDNHENMTEEKAHQSSDSDDDSEDLFDPNLKIKNVTLTSGDNESISSDRTEEGATHHDDTFITEEGPTDNGTMHNQQTQGRFMNLTPTMNCDA